MSPTVEHPAHPGANPYRPDFRPSTIPRCACGVPAILRPDMKGRPAKGAAGDGREMKYWWTCNAGAQNAKTCAMWQVMDAAAEGRGPFVGQQG